jgi:signal transduction histidine kinase
MKSNVRILVVDDSRPMRETVVRTLADREEFIVSEALHGAEGLEMILADSPDMVLLDLEMPHMGGFEVLDALEAEQIDIPIILMTSHGSEVIAVELFRKGVKDYLIKPFSPQEMLSAIDRALTEVRLRQEKEALTRHLATANQQLRRRVQELDTLYRVGKSVTSLLSQEQLLDRILDVIFYVVGAEEAALLLLDEEGGQLQMERHGKRGEGNLQEQAHRGIVALAGKAVRSQDAVVGEAMLAVPLMIGQRVIGVLVAGNRATGRAFSQPDRQMLLALVDYAAIALENARLYGDVRRANQAKSEFVSVVAHELKQPMTSIRGYVSMLMKEVAGPLTAQQKKFINTISNNEERMRVLVSDLQDVSRLETGQLHLDMQPMHLKGALDKALSTVRGQIEARSQELVLRVAENLPQVYADPARLTQILINLLSNACKYTPEGGRVEVQAWLKNTHVQCAVSDNGIGISPEDQEKLFTKFFRADAPLVQEEPGTGLGLCIVKNLVDLQGGEIEVESQPGSGTTFSFSLSVVE